MALKVYKSMLPGRAAAYSAAQNHRDAAATFSERVVALAISIPAGKVTTYGALARAAGAGPMAAQSITNILGKAWSGGKKDIPFHRIVYADGRVWRDPAYDAERNKRYKKEGIRLDAQGRIVDFRDRLVDF